MPKILKNNIIALIFFAITLVIGVTIGVVATNNGKSINFNLAIEYNPEVKVQVDINETMIFNSNEVGSADYQAAYIKSMTSDTINLRKDTVAKHGEQVVLTFYNYNEDKLNIYVNEETTPVSVDAGKSNTKTLAPAEIGALIISLRFEIVTGFTVTFNSMGGSSVSSEIVSEGSLVIKPADPTREGYDFTGWYTSEDNGTTLSASAFNFTNEIISSATTLYAGWQAITLTITINYSSVDLASTLSKLPENVGAASVPSTNWAFYAYVYINGGVKTQILYCNADSSTKNATYNIHYDDSIKLEIAFLPLMTNSYSYSVAGGLSSSHFPEEPVITNNINPEYPDHTYTSSEVTVKSNITLNYYWGE